MLKIMRGHKFFSVFLLTAITVMIIISFVFWGIGPKDNPSLSIVARIEGERITLNEYWQAYDDEYKRVREIYSDEEAIKKLNLKDRVLENLIDRKVLLIAAQRAAIEVTDKELQDAIVNIPYFQQNGVFDHNIYMRALRLNRMTPQMFEEELKNDLILTKMTRLIGETAELTAAEIKILDSIKEGRESLTETFHATKRSQVIKAYVEGLKRQMKIKVNSELIS